MVEDLKKAVNGKLKIVVGGYAFAGDEENKIKQVGADYFAKSYEDILNIDSEEVAL